MIEVVIPYSPRPLQREYHARAQRFALLVCHRRFGKTVAVINDLLRAIVECDKPNPRAAYIAPLFKQAKAVAWDYVQEFCRPIPGVQFNQAELRADLPNGARLSLYGADNPDALRGLYLDAVALDEYAQMSDRLWGEVVRPALADRMGRATFIGTPQGHNAFFDLFQSAKDDQDWYVKVYRASETGYVPASELEAAKRQMSDEQYAQEFECSWTAAIQGSYYGRLLEDAERAGRVRAVNADPGLPVETWWDLGIGDSTAIWFVQRSGPEIRLIDYYENNGEPLAHYVNVIDERRKAGGYKAGKCVLPHDAMQRSLETGTTRVDTLKALGVDAVVLEQSKLEDGIEAVRRMLPNCYFDSLRCARGLDALRQYRAEYDEKGRTYRKRPVHDWSSHGADAFRYGAMFKATAKKWEPLKYDNRGIV